ncbi:MAG: NADP-dependent oxidoreductase [Novosphingobium sp.]|nr:NADP-dependent oxidoreductase [Novosphingobium sp.]
MRNRQWILERRPNGLTVPDDFSFREEDLQPPTLAEGEILIRNMAFICAPTIRNWMEPPGNSLYPSIPLGSPVRGPCAARVIASADPNFPVGSRVCTFSNWQDYDVISAANVLVRTIPDGHSFIDALGPVGMNALTAYFGLLEVGQPNKGETLLVSGAAGSVGLNVAQIGKINGCRVIGIAGGKDKCDLLLDKAGIDACIDYKSENIAERIAALCPDGIDIFFDNVGGAGLQTAIDNMAKFGRIVLCGQISGYNADEGEEKIGNLMRLIYGGIRMQGFLASMYADRFPQAMKQLAQWIDEGKLYHREDVRMGLENLPTTLNALFDGSNQGTLIVQVSDEANETA